MRVLSSCWNSQDEEGGSFLSGERTEKLSLAQVWKGGDCTQGGISLSPLQLNSIKAQIVSPVFRQRALWLFQGHHRVMAKGQELGKWAMEQGAHAVVSGNSNF
jgi:hypothetical protein